MRIAIISFQNNTDVIGAKYIHAYIKKKGYESYLILQPQIDESTDNAIYDFIDKHHIDIVGISLMSYEFYRAVSFSKRLKGKNKDVFIVFGGIHATVAPEECLSVADIVVRGEGEYIFEELIKCIEQKTDYSQLPGICIKRGEKILLNQPAVLEKNLDTFPFPKHLPENMFVVQKNSVTQMDLNLFRKYSRYKGIFPSISTTRGCPFSCTYCCNSAYKKFYKKAYPVRKRSVESVILECLEIRTSHPYIMAINIQDDCFLTHDIEWLRDFINQYKNKIQLPFFLRTTPRHITEEKLFLLKQANLVWIFMGLQSGSDRVNKEIYKRDVLGTEFLEVTNMIKKVDIVGYYDIIVDNPYETIDDNLETIEIALNIPKPFQLQLSSLCFYQGTELAEKAAKENISYDNPKIKNNGLISPSIYNYLIRMSPIYPSNIVRFFTRHRNNRIIEFFIRICNLFNETFIIPLSFVRLIHLSFGSNCIKTVKIVSSYRRQSREN